VFDLETSSLNADFGIVLCAVVQSATGESTVLRGDEINPGWKKGRSDDSALVAAIANELIKYDIICAHNGKRFDVPFIQTRLARWGLSPMPKLRLIDPVLLARNNYKMSSNSLQRLLGMFGLNEKTVVDNDVWLRAALDGDSDAMDYIVEHCVKDVEMLAKLLDKVKVFATKFDNQGSAW
jgi:uncharacterized protein YprB with RNaseH-like and TPR domain